ncbi:REP-associated tyrosine transposase [Thiorhodospira sibirica]|uniref:REP-associated tyrosine transposase n=1 Tax=Thiorhodospira sibirica TaxID=154347 RepID=UPI00022C5E6E|nr:transposase [Thiorhodospira sibirica]
MSPYKIPPEQSHLGWHNRGYLPHYDAHKKFQFITFRLADSLPQEIFKRIDDEVKKSPPSLQKINKSKAIERYIDRGYGCCALIHPRMAECMENSLRHFDADRYHLIAWCIMPNHIHVLIEQIGRLSLIIQSWKSFTGRFAMENNEKLGLNIPGPSFWMPDYWDRYIRDADHFRDVIHYIHYNPVKAGLCQEPWHWPWSSATLPGAHSTSLSGAHSTSCAPGERSSSSVYKKRES